MPRKPFVGGNWKMNLHRDDAVALAQGLAAAFTDTDAVDVCVCPAFPYLASVSEALCAAGSQIKLGAQDGYTQPNGAYTGEVSLSMLQDVGTRVLLTGHSERRHVLGESDHLINAKTLAGLSAGLEVILCVGETLDQREAGQTDAINLGQTALGLAGITAEQMAHVTLAYEPVWVIGTGKTASAADAQAAHAAIRKGLALMFGDAVAQATRIQYGGSVKPSNAAELFSQPDIDGGLIGGAALKVDDFVGILNAAKDAAPA